MTERGGEEAAGLLLDLARVAPEIVVLIADREGRIDWANEAALRLAGPPDTTGARASLGAFFAVADAKAVEGLLRGAPGRHGPRLLNLLDAAGSPVTVRALLESGPGLLLAGVRAVEDERRLGDELVRLNNDLAAATRESARRGRELEKALGELRRTQALLVHREKMASLGQTTAGVAHEINNPLAFVLANTETLRRDFEDLFGFVNAVGDSLDALRVLAPAVAHAIDEAAERAEIVALAESVPGKLAASLEGLERIRGIVTDLRAFSRLDEAERKVVNLVESLSATVRFLGPLQKERGVSVRTELPRELRLACAPGALNQAVANVLTNALQASRPGQAVRLRLLATPGTVKIRVEDDGCGIGKSDLPKVFDPFFTTKPVGEGTGLGLSIAHQVVESHGGRIEIESEPGRGTSVTFLLPVPPGGAG
jgi:signal transduction histidine kinase